MPSSRAESRVCLQTPDAPRLAIGRPFPAQAAYLSALRRKLGADGQPTIARINYVGGRGSAKTTAGVVDMILTASRMPGLVTAWREPRWSDIERVLLTSLRQILPEQLGYYRVVQRRSHLMIEWRNGHVTHLLSRQVDDANARVALGSNYAGVWEDEAADKFQRNKFVDIQNAIRDRRAPYLFHATLSTPVIGEYEAWCHLPGAETLHATSYDNPYISAGVIDEWRASMSPEQWRQEVLGCFIPQAGRIWTGFEERPWPDGNIAEGYQFDPARAWWLSCDLGGGQSAFQIWQYADPGQLAQGRAYALSGRKRVAVMVAEYVPNHIGLGAVLDDVARNYGGGYNAHNCMARPPQCVFVGSDVTSTGVDGNTGAYVFEEFGLTYQSPRGDYARKDTQKMAASAMIATTDGARHFAIAATKDNAGRYQTKQHFGEGKSRGLLACMRGDTFPPVQSREIFIKDKPTRGVHAIEDDRDAFLYFAVCEFPPSIGAGGRRSLELVR